MRDYIVVSPEFEARPATEIDPPERGCDVAYVANAQNAKEAKWAAARLWEKHGRPRNWPNEMRDDGKHPLTGVTVWEPEEREGPKGWKPFYVNLNEENSGS